MTGVRKGGGRGGGRLLVTLISGPPASGSVDYCGSPPSTLCSPTNIRALQEDQEAPDVRGPKKKGRNKSIDSSASAGRGWREGGAGGFAP